MSNHDFLDEMDYENIAQGAWSGSDFDDSVLAHSNQLQRNISLISPTEVSSPSQPDPDNSNLEFGLLSRQSQLQHGRRKQILGDLDESDEEDRIIRGRVKLLIEMNKNYNDYNDHISNSSKNSDNEPEPASPDSIYINSVSNAPNLGKHHKLQQTLDDRCSKVLPSDTDLTIKKEQLLENGKLIREYSSGDIFHAYPDGNVKHVQPDGKITIYFSNGDIQTNHALQGYTKYVYASNGITHIEFESGNEEWRYQDGRVEIHNKKDKSRQIINPDGTIEVLLDESDIGDQ